MEFYEFVIGFLGAVASICTIFWTFVGWAKTPDEIKTKVKAQLRWLGSTAYNTWAIIGAVVVSAANINEIVKFATSAEPLTRPDVLLLLMYLWNAVAYGFAGLIIAALWAKKKKSVSAEKIGKTEQEKTGLE